VTLCLEEKGNEICLAMTRSDQGWFELTTDRAQAGSLYRFQIDGGVQVPDPASRFQPRDVHGPSEVVDGASFDWVDDAWKGRPWSEAVIYELHVGTFTEEGTFAAAEKKLDYLAGLGVTVVELMPVADFPGTRNWGYDGVLPFAPDSQYGRPDDLKRLIQSAHTRGLMVFLDVVYNHFGPEGNYLCCYAPQFFTRRHGTPWGDAINFDGPESRTVRDFFIHNAVYWLNEYRFDGLRLDAVHAIFDQSDPDILTELAERVRGSVADGRRVHLVLENDNNAARYLGDGGTLYDAQWNDDIHHALHVAVTGEKDGYYSDYADCPVRYLARCLAEGFAYQGEASRFRDGENRGEKSRDLPLTAFVSFLQNHDQIGNRAFGERIVAVASASAVRAAMSILLLAPAPPLLFMGEEFGSTTPFLFFCDLGSDLAAAVTEGRRNEFARFERFSDASARAKIPDPCASQTFWDSKLDWESRATDGHQKWLMFYRELLRIRGEQVVPHLRGVSGRDARFEILGARAFSVCWKLAAGVELNLLANLGTDPITQFARPGGTLFYCTGECTMHRLGAWSAAWFLKA
jgi:malto-oligosyltrehalose trehalohydrolase